MNTSPQINTQMFRDAMARLASAVTIITTDGEHGRYGFTASAVSSVTDTPPTLLVCINRQTKTHPVLLKNGTFAVNILSDGHETLSNHFATSAVSMEERFSLGAWHTGKYKQPILEDALVSIECTVSNLQDVGTHTVVFGEVLNINIHPSKTESLLWAKRQYISI
ncbi:flavin reductase [Neokomagataea anthophila]|uniref:Flavin reductase n=1 Tax=Neokomagataea anthophila TaxID=2826925 RepID=A0ABS5E9H4_9PROT|nr:flavin reductase [Neokomagataea anthophila]MBR0560559.1 flavin reductase [Neokomagataea anthophila]